MAGLTRINSLIDRQFYKSNLYVDAVVIYSLRKLRYDYNGPAIRVRRDSDNSESDIYFDGWGRLDESALLSFVGTGGSNNGFITKIYEQVSGTIEAVQASASAQPKIVNAGEIYRVGRMPSIKFDVSYLESSFPTTYSQPNTIFIYGRNDGKRNYSVLTDGRSSAPVARHIIYHSDNLGNYSFYSGIGVSGGPTDDLNHVLTGIFNSPNSNLYVDGVLNASGDTGSLSFAPINLGAVSAGSPTAADGFISEVVIFNDDRDLHNRSQIEKDIIKYHR